MTIFVSGGAGYIGSHTCIELLAAGHSIVAADNFSNSHPKAVERVRELAGRDFPFYEMDVRDEKALAEIFNRHQVEGVIHFAGYKAVGESVQKPLDYYENNLCSTLAICRAMERTGVKTIIFSSSATVYRGDNPMPVDETAATGDCLNPYGWTKYMCERILTDTAAAKPDWNVTLLRYFNPVGAHASGLIGEDPSDIPNNLMPYISQTAIGRREMLSVFGGDYDTPDGTGVRDYIHVVDLAKGHVAALGRGEPGVAVYNLGTGQGTSVLQMADAFQRINNVAVPRKIVGRRAGDLATCYADASKAGRELGWKAEKTLEDMCADSWRWQSKNPNGYC